MNKFNSYILKGEAFLDFSFFISSRSEVVLYKFDAIKITVINNKSRYGIASALFVRVILSVSRNPSKARIK